MTSLSELTKSVIGILIIHICDNNLVMDIAIFRGRKVIANSKRMDYQRQIGKVTGKVGKI